MKVYHISAECYPVAKTGGLGDVVGALPKYQNQSGVQASVIMPWYDKPFVKNHAWIPVYKSEIRQGSQFFNYTILKEESGVLGFDLYLVHIPGLLDRSEVYGYADEADQFIAFQHALLHWLSAAELGPDLFHCHDHHSGLVPFFIEHCADFGNLKGTPTVATVHNGQYQGWMNWPKAVLFPPFDNSRGGLLDWNGLINPLAALIKCCWAYNTVSRGYLEELLIEANGLESLFSAERNKGFGIINGIDNDTWDPETDAYLFSNFSPAKVLTGKRANKVALCNEFGLDPTLPLMSFIGRFALEKGADMLPPVLEAISANYSGKLSFFILGSGDPQIQDSLRPFINEENDFAIVFGYNEELSHRIYAASDFLLMPSRVEPCGLNQLYAMKYGTVPVVRNIGGLKDTVRDIEEQNSNGIVFQSVSSESIVSAVGRALSLYEDAKLFGRIRKKIMKLDHSWNNSTKQYIQLYENLINRL